MSGCNCTGQCKITGKCGGTTSFGPVIPSKEEISNTLNECSTALNHWMNQYAPEFCDEQSVIETKTALRNANGTLFYIAKLNQDVKQLLQKLQ